MDLGVKSRQCVSRALSQYSVAAPGNVSEYHLWYGECTWDTLLGDGQPLWTTGSFIKVTPFALPDNGRPLHMKHALKKKPKNRLCHFSQTQGTSKCCVGGYGADWFHWAPAKFWSCGHQRRIISSKTCKWAIITGWHVLVCIQRDTIFLSKTWKRKCHDL